MLHVSLEYFEGMQNASAMFFILCHAFSVRDNRVVSDEEAAPKADG